MHWWNNLLLGNDSLLSSSLLIMPNSAVHLSFFVCLSFLTHFLTVAHTKLWTDRYFLLAECRQGASKAVPTQS